MIAFLLACSSPEPLPKLLEVPEFSLTSQKQESVSRDSLKGKVWLADFIFTSCPGPCPILSAKMAEIQAHYVAETDLRLVSFTVDPVTDTPPVLATYATRFGAGPNWIFLTGDPAVVQSTIVDGFKQMLERLPNSPNIMHSERLVLVDRDGWMRAFPEPNETTELYSQVDAVLKEGRWW